MVAATTNGGWEIVNKDGESESRESRLSFIYFFFFFEGREIHADVISKESGERKKEDRRSTKGWRSK